MAHFEIEIMCSCCGFRKTIPNSIGAIDDTCNEGWNSFGSALYCPECVRTWHERNSKPLAGKQNTFTIMAAKCFKEYERRTK